MSTTETVAPPEPGSAEWLRYMTASKVSAVMGTSPFESPFSLWHRMHGDIDAEAENDQETYGKVIEPALVAWFAAIRPDLTLDPAAPTWIVSTEVPWAAATPDAIVVEADGYPVPLEVKTGRDAWEWGESESFGPIPAGYYDQVQWQMLVLGSDHAYVAADVMMTLRWYRIDRDEARQDEILATCQEFMDSLAAHQAPPIDGSTFTYTAIRVLHPEIDDVQVDADPTQAREFLAAHTAATRAAAREQLAKSRLIDAMGNARRLRHGDLTLFTRQAKNGGTPYAVAGRHLPDIEED